MRKIILFFLLPVMLCTINSFAKGHGGGGHGGGHSGGHSGGHAGGRASGGGHVSGSGRGMAGHTTGRQSGGHMSRGGGFASPGSAGRTMGTTQRTSSGAMPRMNQMNGFRSAPRTTTNGGPRNYKAFGTVPPNYHPHEHWNSYPYYYYGSYGYAPYYDPYFSMWSFGLNFMYTPHYYPSTSGYSNDNQGGGGGGSNDYDNNESMEGFVVYEHDTITGEVTLTNNAVQVETADTARGYDYKFKMKQQGLQYVSVYDNNDTNNQMNLVRLKDDKRLLRQVHVGKLMIYDGRHGFIHRTEDIDVGTVTVVYNGESDAIHSSSTSKTKEWLTDYVNKAYGLTLKPVDFSWKELLIYIDKLD